VLVRVNGVAITQQEVQAEDASGGSAHFGASDTSTRPPGQALLFAIVQQEVAAQRAQALGLTADGDYQRELAQREAELSAWKRKKLAALFFRQEVQAKAVVSDQEVQRYFEANQERIETELHLRQIFTRDVARIEAAYAKLQAGAAFEDVARQNLPPVRVGEAPWDLGFQRWSQMPDAWVDVAYGLAEGRHSGVIKGPNQRYWILELVAKRKTDLRFEQMREPVRRVLQGLKLAELRKAVDADLIEHAKIVYSEPATAPAPSAEGR